LPEDLRGKSPDEVAKAWLGWVCQRDKQIRARLAQGEEDTLVNYMLFGTSFTKQPRETPEAWQRMHQKQENLPPGSAKKSPIEEAVLARIRDLVRSAREPGRNERSRFAALVFTRRGLDLKTVEGRAEAEEFLAASLSRVLKESESYASVLRQAKSLGDPTEEFARRSTLFSTRGLSLDTSWRPSFALEQALATMKAKGLIKPGSMRRVAVVGPGLDFTDKQEGYDFYPQQTIQPFALFDSLVRLGLSNKDGLKITTLDISNRVNAHLAHARQLAGTGRGYVVQLPLDPETTWTPDAIRYWEHMGDKIGSPVAPAAVPATLRSVKVRAIRIPPATVLRVRPVDLNIILQRLEFPLSQRFDLIVATNILVYYDTFEQTLALANAGRMLQPGGWLLSNNALLELPDSKMKSIDYASIPYSNKAADGDQIVWYRRSEK